MENEFLANPALPRLGQEVTATTRLSGYGKGGHKDAAGIRGLEGAGTWIFLQANLESDLQEKHKQAW